MKSYLLVLIVLLYPLSVFGEPKCVGTSCFETIVNQDKPLNLQGTSIYEYYFLDIYAGAFYSDKPILGSGDVFNPDSSKYLVLEYLVGISKSDFVKSTKAIIAKNKNVEYSAIAKDFERVYAAFEDVKAKDRYSLSYNSETKQTCLALNGVQKVCGVGQEFFKAFFGIWVSEYSVGEKFTQELLGKS